MDETLPDPLLKKIVEHITHKPEKPNTEWYADLARLLVYSPLKLRSESPKADKDGHTYLVFQLPSQNEIPDVDYSQYTLYEYAGSLIELHSGAIIEHTNGENLWSFSLGSMLNILREKDPYQNKDQRLWGWPKQLPPPNQILLQAAQKSCLPPEIINAIETFIKSIQPPIEQWGMATYKKNQALTMFIKPSLPIKQADPEPILKHLRWFTPHHFCWTALDQ